MGTTLEFKAPGTFTPVSDIVGGGPFGLKPGQWTDDTSMALCLAESLIACRGELDLADQLRLYVRWWRQGYLSSTGRCFDIGKQTREALAAFEGLGIPAPPEDPDRAGNGSIMRLAPVPITFHADPTTAVAMSGESSRTTHPAPRAVDGCRYLGALIAGALNGRDKTALLDGSYWRWGVLHPEIAEVAAGSFKHRQPPAIKGSGYVVRSLEAALWALWTTSSFADGALAAVNLGDDTDSTGAVYGQIAGAVYGVEAIPPEWLAKVTMRERITELADQLLAVC